MSRFGISVGLASYLGLRGTRGGALSRDTPPIQNQPCLCPELPLHPSTSLRSGADRKSQKQNAQAYRKLRVTVRMYSKSLGARLGDYLTSQPRPLVTHPVVIQHGVTSSLPPPVISGNGSLQSHYPSIYIHLPQYHLVRAVGVGLTIKAG